MTYSDALALALDAVRGGEPLEDVVARLPQHAARLRADVVLTREVSRFATAVRPPSDQARASAAAGLQGQLRASRAAAAEAKPVGRRPWLRRAPALPRLAAFAVAVAALALAAVALLPGGDGRTVEAAVLEGVVIERDGDSLTIQTLDALEQIFVPADTPISDVAGVRIAFDRISVGEVVVVAVQRSRGSVVAQQVAKLQESIDVWCSDASERCRVLADRLDAAEADCRLEPRACQAFVERLAELRLRATDVASLEELKARCRSGNATACESLVAFCRAHSAICRSPSQATSARMPTRASGCGGCARAARPAAPPPATSSAASARARRRSARPTWYARARRRRRACAPSRRRRRRGPSKRRRRPRRRSRTTPPSATVTRPPTDLLTGTSDFARFRAAP